MIGSSVRYRSTSGLRLTRDLDLAVDLAQETLAAALEQWPQSGVSDNPAAWLTATANRRAIDLFRRNAFEPEILIEPFQTHVFENENRGSC